MAADGTIVAIAQKLLSKIIDVRRLGKAARGALDLACRPSVKITLSGLEAAIGARLWSRTGRFTSIRNGVQAMFAGPSGGCWIALLRGNLPPYALGPDRVLGALMMPSEVYRPR